MARLSLRFDTRSSFIIQKERKKMPRVGLEISFDVENVASVEAVGKDFRWFLKICCGNCGEVTDWVYVDEEDTVEVKGGRGTAHMVLNCKVRRYIPARA